MIQILYLLIYEGRQTEQVKDLDAQLPHVDAAVLAQTLVIEAVDLCDLPRLVVTSD